MVAATLTSEKSYCERVKLDSKKARRDSELMKRD